MAKCGTGFEAARRQPSRTEARWRRWGGAVAAFGARHRIMVGLTAVAVALRVAVVLGYRPVLWFNDSYGYVTAAVHRHPASGRVSGYSLFLALMQPLHSFTAVAVAQHLMGLGMGVLIYAVLRQWGLPGWGAALAALPVLVDAYQLQLEHLVMSDTLFALLVTAAVVVACWRDRPSVPAAIGVGLLVGAAAIVRATGWPLLAAVVGCLAVRRAGWRPTLAVVVFAAVPLLAYASWFHAAYGRFALSQSGGAYLYSRVMAFADCAKFEPSPKMRVLCDARPPAERPITPAYLWSLPPEHPLAKLSYDQLSPADDKMARQFALRAIRAQPLDYLRVSALDLLRTFGWTRSQSYPDVATARQYRFTDAPGVPPAGWDLTDERAYQPHGGLASRAVQPWARLLASYQRQVYFRGSLLAAALLVGAAGLLRARSRAVGLLPWCVAVVLIVAPVATAGFSYRYVLAAVPSACLATALAFAPRRKGKPGRVCHGGRGVERGAASSERN